MKLLANLGDIDFATYGGTLVFDDSTMHVIETDKMGRAVVYRFGIDKCTLVNGIVSDNRFHPECAAWFAKSEAERSARPQDSTYLSNVANFGGVALVEIQQWLCSEDIIERAMAYNLIGLYHGFVKFDQYPETYTRTQLAALYEKIL
jgi:hypothetical protein